MPKITIIPFEREPVKTCWHTYSLQGLQPDQFVRAVRGILTGEMILVSALESSQETG